MMVVKLIKENYLKKEKDGADIQVNFIICVLFKLNSQVAGLVAALMGRNPLKLTGSIPVLTAKLKICLEH